MADLDKVIREIKLCIGEEHDCQSCSRYGHGEDLVGCMDELLSDALELLKERETVEHALDVLRKNGWKEEGTCEKCTLLTAVPDGVHDIAKQFRKVGEVE